MRRIGLLLIAALAFGCNNDDNEFVEIPGDAGQVPPGTFEWRATLVSVNPAAFTITGDVVVAEVETEAAFTATITIRNDTVGAIRPWHVHFGTCAAGDGAIVGTDIAYPRLQTGTGGAASTNVMIRVGLDPAIAYHVDVHASETDDTVIACGDMVLQ